MTQLCQLSRTPARTAGHPIGWVEYDPLDRDLETDPKVLVSPRSLVRLALIASEVGARFQREGIGQDPMAWMLAPRALFEGGAAIEACLERAPCMRSLVLHGLGLGLDATVAEIGHLVDDDEEGDEGLSHRNPRTPPDIDEDDRPERRQRLFTSLMVDEADDGVVQAFEAIVATDSEEARARIRSRHGDRIAGAADIREGFDASVPLAEALVSPALVDILRQVAAYPASPLARGLEVTVAQRFVQ